MKLFYNIDLNYNDKELTLFDSEHSHLTKVLRKKVDEIVYLTNGRGYLFEAVIIQINLKDTKLKILSSLKKPKRNYYLNVAISPTKKNDRFEWFVEKATELGISQITPIVCEHSEKKKINTERLERILISSLKQSNQFFKPEINSINTFENFILNNEDQLFMANLKTSNKLSEKLFTKSNICLMVGPEGGFSDREIDIAKKQDIKEVTLGNSRLRSETAAIYGMSIIRSMLH